MKILFLFFLVVMGTGWSSCSAGLSCERINHQVCQGLGYNYTLFPNRFNHDTQDQAILEMHQFYPLVRIGCSSSLRKFLCSMYMPVCSKTPLPSCRSLCEQVKSNCEPVMKRFGMSWPKKFKCSDFPDFKDKICISSTKDKSAPKIPKLQPPTTTSSTTAATTRASADTTTTVASTTTAATTTTSTTASLTTAAPSSTTRAGIEPARASKCEKITIPLCQELLYNLTIFPNRFGHRTQKQAGLEIKNYSPLFDSAIGSPKYVRLLFCSLYAPVCTVLEDPLPPCRSFCERTKKWSVPVMSEFGLSWPDKFNCSNFPDFGDKICISSTEDESAPKIPKLQPETTTSSTKAVTTRASADTTITVAPTTTAATTTASTTASPTTPAPSSTTREVEAARASNCEKITIPLCQGLPYNHTMLPTRFHHRSQKEAGLEIGNYSLLVDGRHKYVPLFFCSLYLPKCTVLKTTIPPCRSLCERTKKLFVPILNEAGLSWQDKFNCAYFPESSSEAICISGDNKNEITTKTTQQLLTKVQGVFTSPNYPKPYPKGIERKWIIQLPDSYKVVKITIKKMRLEEDRNCLYDYIIIKDKMLNQVGPRHCGTYRSPYQVLVRGNKAIITFVSDESTSKGGFVIKYKGLQNDSNSA